MTSSLRACMAVLSLLGAGCIERPFADKPQRPAIDRAALKDVLVAATPQNLVPVGASFGPIAFRDFVPPIQVNPSALTFTVDPPSLVLAYSDGAAIFEAVLSPSALTGSMGAPAAPSVVVTHSPGSISLDGVAYAPSSSLGGGRYVWRELTAGGGMLRSRRRNLNLP